MPQAVEKLGNVQSRKYIESEERLFREGKISKSSIDLVTGWSRGREKGGVANRTLFLNKPVRQQQNKKGVRS